MGVPMRSVLLASLLVSTVACHKSTSGGGGDDTTGPDAADTNTPAAFTITSTDITLPAGAEITKCFYFHTPNTTALAVNKWTSHMTPGSHHMIMFLGSATQPADGTIDDNCGIGGGAVSASNIPVWVYSSQMPDQTETLPTDDGGGKPLAQNIAPNQPAYFQMHYLNATDADLVVHVSVSAYALDPGAAYTETAAYVSYNGAITIAPHAVGTVASQTCQQPTGLKFWTLSSHSHKQSVHTDIKDGTAATGAVVFQSDDWEHPGSMSWMTSPFYTFASTLTFECTYNNTGDNANNMIVDGQSAQTNEMCMAVGYYFPATATKICYCYSAGSCITL